MRKDYKYVDEATVVCLTTTPKGDAWLSEQWREDKDGTPTNDLMLNSLLCLVQDAYIELPQNAGIEEMSAALMKYDKEQLLNPEEYNYKVELIQAFAMGYIGVHKVIWD